jgi:SAM-dependent methyltransferase
MSEDWYLPNKEEGVFGSNYIEEFDIGENRTLSEVDVLSRLISETFIDRPKIIDLAGGYGRISSHLLETDFPDNIVNIDINEDFTNKAVANGLTSVVGDIRHLPFNNESFDLALLMFTSFGYFSDRRDDMLVVKEAHRILRPKGLLLIDMSNFLKICNNFEPYREKGMSDGSRIIYYKEIVDRRLYEARKRIMPDGQEIELAPMILNIYEPDELVGICESIGFSSVDLLDNKGREFDPENSRRLWIKANI